MFWERFLQLCNENNIKPTPLMKELGFSTGLPSQWKKSGQNPSHDKLCKIAAYFGVPLDYFNIEQLPALPNAEISTENKMQANFAFYPLNEKCLNPCKFNGLRVRRIIKSKFICSVYMLNFLS